MYLAMTLDDSDLQTLIAALRSFQESYEGSDASEIYDDWEEYFTHKDGSKIEPLSTPDIDEFIKRIRSSTSVMNQFERMPPR